MMKLTDVVNRINGNVDRFTTDLEYYIGGEHFESRELEISNKGLIKPNLNILGFKFHFAYQERDVIFMARNPHLRKAGMVFFSGLCSDASYILRSKDEKILTQEYLAVMLQSDHFWDYCEAHKVGSVNFAINWKTMANYEFDLPSLEKQNEISKKVWAAYRLKKSYIKLIEATDEMVKSQFIEMFGGIQNDLKWPLKPLGELCEMVNGYAFKSTLYSDSGYSIIRIANVQKGNIDDSDKVYYSEQYKDEFNDSILKEGDILISLTGNVGRAGVVYNKHLPAALNQRVQGLRIKDASELNHQYLFSLLNLDSFEELCIQNASGSAQLNLSTVWLRNCKIVCPAIDEQVKFALIAQQADKSKFELRKSIDAIDAVIKSLING